MFIQMLDQKQQSVFLALAYKMAHADGVVVPEEKARLQAIEAQMPGIRPDEAGIASIASIFVTRQAKVAMLLELAGVAMADETIAGEENALLQEVSATLSINSGELNDLVSWVSRAFYLFREVQSFMEE